MLNIFYCHGFASSFDPNKSKIQTLSRLGTVDGCHIDYTQQADEVVIHVIEQGNFANVDVIVGTSMGGWLAATLGSSLGIPFVAINPVVDPSKALHKYVGEGVDHQGAPYTLSQSAVASYYSIAKNGCGLILLDDGDEVIDATHTKRLLKDHYEVKVFEGGNHRFAHMEEALPLIEAFAPKANN